MAVLSEEIKREYYRCICKIYHIINKDKSIFNKNTMANLESVKRKLNIIGQSYEFDQLIIRTYGMFLKFSDKIEADEVEYLIEYDYETLIEEDAYDENKKLITDLIRGAKYAWKSLSQKDQQILKQNIKVCLTISRLYELH